MADSSLDDFFAKKDKSKKKSKSKIKPEDILAQQGDSEKRVKKKKAKESKKTEVEAQDADKSKEDDEEWKDYVEEEKVDYTGLRIKEMQLAKAAQEEKEEEERKEEEEEGKENKEGGPWNKAAAESTETYNIPESKPEPKPEPEPAKTMVGKYVPPSRRGESNTPAVITSTQPSRRKKKEAPNLHSEHDFPTLGGADYTQGGEFEEVKVGGRQTEDPSKQHMKLKLDNKFGALENDDS